MKHKLIIIKIILLILISLIFYACTSTVSIDERITNFINDLNSSDRSSTYLNFHETLTNDYNAIKSAGYWDAAFIQSWQLYNITNYTTTMNSDTTATISGTFKHALDSGSVILLEMAKSGDDWYIKTLVCNLATIA